MQDVVCALLDVRPGDRVLDDGTGSGNHPAVLARHGGRVWSDERQTRVSEAAAAFESSALKMRFGAISTRSVSRGTSSREQSDRSHSASSAEAGRRA